MKRMSCIPLHNKRGYNIIRIERGAVMEQYTLTQVKCPFGQVLVGFIGLGQTRLYCRAADFVSKQGLGHLFTGPQGLAVGLVCAVQGDRFSVLHPYEGVLSRMPVTAKFSLPSGLA